MNATETEHPRQCKDEKATTSRMEPHTSVKRKKSLSMHEDVPVWYDCCSCEAEPYWIESMQDKASEVDDNI